MSFFQFILIAYTFTPIIKEYFTIKTFVFTFLAVYLPSATIIGHLHLKHIVPTESMITAEITPYRDVLLDGKEKMATQHTIANIEYTLDNIRNINLNIDYQLMNIEYTLVNVDYFKFQNGIVEKNMRIMNFLLREAQAPTELLFSEEEIHGQRRWVAVFGSWQKRFIPWLSTFKTQHGTFESWSNVFKDWGVNFTRFRQGERASVIMGAEKA